MKYSIQTDNLNFRYSKSKKILENLSINVPKGSIYGFLGPNGAGKSTTMRLLTGIIPDDTNAVKVFGTPLNEQMPDVFNNLGALVESPALYLHLSGEDNLKYIAKIRGVADDKIDEVLNLVDLEFARKQKAKQYSLGMKQRLAIAIALLGDPELLLLDEPVNGLDPNGIVEIRKLLVKISKERGTTIFISSHLLSEIEKMCTHVGIIANGKLKFEGTMQELAVKFDVCKVTFVINNAAEWVRNLEQVYPEIRQEEENAFSIELQSKNDIPALTKRIVLGGGEIFEIKIQEGLEEWFMNLTESN
ncbi:ATP-binding cassette domain-containing protein [Flavobacterium enshiense]|uniref:ABC transporter ATP-binding protein n=1 Tax=Flavobacterium enshiense TaxID=1341165 RepID=UPI00345C863F